MRLTWVNTGWIVGADVPHYNGVILAGLKICLKSLEVESLSRRVVVAVVFGLVANKFSDGVVNGPGGLGGQKVDIFVRVPLCKECESKAEGASS